MSTITTADKFARTEDFASRLDSVFFADEVWAVFAELDQPASAAQIAERLHESPDAVLNAINVLIGHQLVRRQLKSWRDFLAQKGADGTTSTPSAPVAEAQAARRPGAALAGWPQPSASVDVTNSTPAPAAEVPDVVPESMDATPASAPVTSEELPDNAEAPVLFTDFQLPTRPLHETHTPDPTPAAVVPEPAPVVASAPVAPSPSPVAPSCATGTVLPVSFTIANTKARIERRATVAMTISFRISAKSASTVCAWKLRPLLQAIEQKGGGGLPGQLLVYRVFIHVPADMMHAAGIQSLSLVDDSVVVRDRAFYDALCQAAHAVASIDLRAISA